MISSYPLVFSPFPYGAIKPRRADSYPNLPIPNEVVPPAEYPAPLRDPTSFCSGYTVTSHIIPAAYPRCSHTEPLRYAETDISFPDNEPPEDSPKAIREEWAIQRARLFLKRCNALNKLKLENAPEDGSGSSSGHGPVMWNAVNRYSKTSPRENEQDVGLTVIIAHANGLHKETFEPMLRYIIEQSRLSQSGFCVEDVWCIDAANHGDSALLNKENLGHFFDGMDHGRDIINLAENFIPEGPFKASQSPLPLHLLRVPSQVSKKRALEGITDRHVVAIGHSFGGYSTVIAAMSRPKLFHSLTLVDPVLIKRATDEIIVERVSRTLMRRQKWTSKADALDKLSKNPFFAEWSPEALKLYVEFGTYETDDGRVQLKTDRYQEAVVFAELWLPAETWTDLASLDERVRLHWIMAGNPMLGTHEAMRNMVWRRPANSSNVRITGAGHLLVQLVPVELANAVSAEWSAVATEKKKQNSANWASVRL